MVMYEMTHNDSNTVVLVPCTGKKIMESGMAINVYYPTGAIASIKSALNDREYNPNIDSYFLSGKHGILRLDEIIEAYEYEVTQDDKPKLKAEVGQFLLDHDYDVLFSFVDGIYQKAVDEVAYSQKRWDFDTIMLQPCGRTSRFDGASIMAQIIRKGPDILSAAETGW